MRAERMGISEIALHVSPAACLHHGTIGCKRGETMSARRIARELAVIVMPQLPKDRQKMDSVDYDGLVAKSVSMLVDYAKQNLAEANALLLKSAQLLSDVEVEHPHNVDAVEEMVSVPIKSGQLKEHLAVLDRALELVAEALDIPEMALHSGKDAVEVKCRNCDHVSKVYTDRADKSEVREFLISLVSTYLDHRSEIDQFIKHAKATWQVERMVSIDRDILRLACTEAFFLPDIPVNVCISEAVELSHRFADEKAARFINGVLGDLAEDAKYFRRTGKFREESATESAPIDGSDAASESESVETGSAGGARL
jgi:N utilization substance protein B